MIRAWRSAIDRALHGVGQLRLLGARTFDLDDDGFAVVLDAEGDHEDQIRNAADGCPTQAIVLS